MKQIFPKSAYNLISLIGAGLALFGLAAIIILYLMDSFSGHTNPYLGIFTFVVFPGVMVFGLLLIPVGMWRYNRQGREPMVVNLGIRHHRNALVTFVAGTSVFLLLTTVGLYEGYHYTESVEFCGKVCHNVMEPEHTAHQYSSHARVPCVACHIGPGADWYVQSKISGARQVLKAALNIYPRPVLTPIENLRPAKEVCEQCHWPDRFFPAAQVINNYYLSDKENTHWQIQLMVKVGGIPTVGKQHASGIHWHVDPDNKITYVADHTREKMKRVTWTRKDGTEVEYTINGRGIADSTLAHAREEGLERTMDCMDCHNRPAHRYQSPMEAVNEALAANELSGDIPWIKREAVTALTKEYATKEGAMDSIALHLEEFYEGIDYDLDPRAVETVQGLYSRNMFPHMKARWDVYPDHINHFIFEGCFRCHGSNLKTADGQGISNDCNTCHVILAQGPADSIGEMLSASGLEFRHPVDIGGAEKEMNCTECHFGDDSLY